MNIRPKLRMPLLAAALAATVASSWAAYEMGNASIGNSSLIPAPAADAPGQAVATPLATETVIADEKGLAPNEQVVTPTTETPVAAKQPAAVPVVESARAEPAITVEQQRLSVDQRIQADVIDLLARNPNLSGKIGVVSADAVVTLTGWTTTSGMAWRAGRDARGVIGVRHVVNEIRPKVGGITS
jgi:hypothetical protein